MSQSHEPSAQAHAQQESLICPRVDQLQSQILDITKKHGTVIQRVCKDGAVLNGGLQDLEGELAAIGIRPDELPHISGNQELRRFLGLVLGSRELESSGAYRLQDLDQVLTKRPQAFCALFSSPVLAQVLGAVLTSPTHYHEFSQNRDALALELVTIKLRGTLSTEQFAEWQRGAGRSLLMGYQGVQESPSPERYAKAVQLRENSFVFDSEQIRDRTASKIQQLLQVREPIPGILWGILAPESRRAVSLYMPMNDVLAWTRDSLRNIAGQSQKHHQNCLKFEKEVGGGEGATKGRGVQPRESAAALRAEFEQHCASMYEICRFLLLYLDDKMEDLGQDPIRERLAPQCQHDREAQKADLACFQNGRLREIVQKAIGRDLVSAMRGLCESMACKGVELKCSEKFAQGVVELLDELNVYLDVQDEGSSRKPFYSKYLLPCFQQAIGRHDFDSARAIRLLFPPDDRLAPTVKRFLVDDYIRDHRDDILDALAAEASEISQMMDQAVRQKTISFPAEIDRRLSSFQNALRHFPLDESISTVDPKLIGAVGTAIYALLTWDSVVENEPHRAENDDRAGDASSRMLRAFTGSRRAAELLGALGADSSAQRCTMKAVLSQVDLRPREALANFIMHTNFQLVQALQALAATKVTLNEILPECQAAFDADRLYRASPGQHDRLPDVMIRYFPPLLEVGYHILVRQEEMVPPEGLQVIRANDLNCVRSWQAGIVGKGHHPRRHELMRKFFDFVEQNGGDIPLDARSLVLESVAHFAWEFADKVETAVDRHEFVRGVSHVLTGFLIPARKISPEHHISIARSLARIFATPSAGFLCKGDTHRYAVVEGFKSLATSAESQEFNEVMEKFLNLPAIQALLQNVGILRREQQMNLPDEFRRE